MHLTNSAVQYCLKWNEVSLQVIVQADLGECSCSNQCDPSIKDGSDGE